MAEREAKRDGERIARIEHHETFPQGPSASRIVVASVPTVLGSSTDELAQPPHGLSGIG